MIRTVLPDARDVTFVQRVPSRLAILRINVPIGSRRPAVF
jgi:hypothetical protein